jgi:hypothetical protein
MNCRERLGDPAFPMAKESKNSYDSALFGFIVMIVFMTTLVIFAYAVRRIAEMGTFLARALIWFIFLFFMAIVTTVLLRPSWTNRGIFAAG